MKRNTKVKDYFAAKSRKSESSGIMDDVCMAFCVSELTIKEVGRLLGEVNCDLSKNSFAIPLKLPCPNLVNS
jgi:hypothetical protein